MQVTGMCLGQCVRKERTPATPSLTSASRSHQGWGKATTLLPLSTYLLWPLIVAHLDPAPNSVYLPHGKGAGSEDSGTGTEEATRSVSQGQHGVRSLLSWRLLRSPASFCSPIFSTWTCTGSKTLPQPQACLISSQRPAPTDPSVSPHPKSESEKCVLP